ncbi:pyridine nucleotide-disulfide oxidoreductase [Staphylococcus gallinarum]|uniref:Pyridine nucleotide-disulfide oxidoreductase n=1 Tax=Staphylococcus gallinarum TaxID=1293 RepID=A0A3A0VJ32_STAGA|nr:FAD/NAD(P)-binding protein [Staphylococcus gallinarum]RIP34017.1 pyridine nucleotide-disulfide oxidoreductase [Staphylococcus gallinarum]
MRIAIIGMGTAGVTVLKELSKSNHFQDMQIDAYDNPTNMGQGVPFQNDSEQLLINLPAAQMSLDLGNKREFYEWYQQQTKFKFSNSEYLPRFVFGHYMKAYMDKINNDNDNVTLIKEQVSEVFIESNIGDIDVLYRVCTSNDMEYCKTYDVVFLTVGTLSYHDPYNLKGKPGFIHTPYPTYNTLNNVKVTDNIAIVGTGLASLDAIRYVTEHHFNLPVTVASRKGELPSVRGEMPEITFQYITPEKFNELKANNFGNVPLDDAMILFFKECAKYEIPVEELVHRKMGIAIEDLKYDLEHAEVLGKFQSLLELIKENFNWIWNSFNRKDQERFLQKYQPILKANSNPMPPRTAKLLIELIENEHIKICDGLTNIEYKNHQFQVTFSNGNSEAFDVVINATGSKTQLEDLDSDDQLIINLENRQVIQGHPLGGIQIVAETNQVISPRYGTLQNMFALGQLTNGINQSRNGVTMIVRQASGIITKLLEN